jgi:hypothetical protein
VGTLLQSAALLLLLRVCDPPTLLRLQYTNDNYTALHIDAEGKISEVDMKEPADAAAAAAVAAPSAAAGSTQVTG